MKMYLVLLIIALFTEYTVNAQVVLLEDDVEKNMLIPEKGPNRKHFSHFFIGVGSAIGMNQEKEAKTEMSESIYSCFGFRYKRKIASFYAIGFDLQYNFQNYGIKQEEGKQIPNTILHDSEKLSVHGPKSVVYNRINFGKRGNRVGVFTDIGAFGEYLPFQRHVYKDELPDGRKIKVRYTCLPYIEHLQYGVIFRFGIDNIAGFAKYRLSDLFVAKYNYPELNTIICGLQIGLHR